MYRFYKLVRILGFYGVIFIGKLKPYSGPAENTPKVLCFPESTWINCIDIYHLDSHTTSTLQSCGIKYIKQLHGVPVETFAKITGFAIEENIDLPFTIKKIHDNFFDKDIRSVTHEQIEKNTLSEQLEHALSRNISILKLSLRANHGLGKANINHIRQLIQQTDENLLSIPHFGRNCLIEIKRKLLKIGLKNGITLDQLYNANSMFFHSIENLSLPRRSYHCLKNAQINTIGELLTKTDEEFLALKNLGLKSLKERNESY